MSAEVRGGGWEWLKFKVADLGGSVASRMKICCCI